MRFFGSVDAICRYEFFGKMVLLKINKIKKNLYFTGKFSQSEFLGKFFSEI